MTKIISPDQIKLTDADFMRLAISQGQIAAQHNEVPVGAVLVHENEVVAWGRNSPITDSDPSSHAEINAMRAAGQHFKNYRLEHCRLYVTLEPCPMCMGAILQARLSEVIYALPDPKMGACGSVLHLHEDARLNSHTQVRQCDDETLSADSKTLLQSFFRSKRKNPNLRLSSIDCLEDLPNMDKTLIALLKAQGITSPLHLHAFTAQPVQTMLDALPFLKTEPNRERYARIKALHHFIAGGCAISWKDFIEPEQSE